MPGTIQLAPTVITLERGRESNVTVPLAAIGGVLEIEADDASIAIVTDAAGNQRRSAAEAGLARVTSLLAGP